MTKGLAIDIYMKLSLFIYYGGDILEDIFFWLHNRYSNEEEEDSEF